MTQPQNSYGYVDTSYLNLTANQLQFFKNMTYEKMRLQPGQQVLDLGCGPASDTITLAKWVGETGKVVGVDYDPGMIDAAQQKAEAAGVSSYVTHEVHEATQLPYADNTFDSCRSERVFQHLLEPEKALAELVRVTKPGGWIVIGDADWGSVVCYTSLPEIEAKVKAAYTDKGAQNPIIGRQLHPMLRRAGLESVSATPATLGFTNYETANFVASLHSKLKPRGLEGGYFTEEEFDRFVNDLKQHDAQGNFFAYMCGIVAAGQKPS
jgi:ubiquinone/menaquinone biosynthesis C-methylase UbiE